MLLNLLEYHWVEDIDEALLLMGRADVKTVPLAGGTHLLGLDDDSIEAVVDLRDLELGHISEDATSVHIGAMTTLQNMVDAPILKELATGVLATAAQASSFSRVIRNSATLGGTLAIGATSQADVLTVLAALDAEALLRSGSRTKVDLSAGSVDRPGFALAGVTFKGKLERRVSCVSLSHERRSNELIIEVIIPRPPAGTGASFQRIGRTPTDVALLNACALVEVKDSIYKRVHLALGGVNMDPLRMPGVEKQLEGQVAMNEGDTSINTQLLVTALQAGMADFQPPADFRASTGYRKISGVNLALRALEEATNISRWRNMVSSKEKQ
ncbi:MAG TPA: FAD binding domain-containing protein [Ktedonobacteraceae bacterium]|nr:FAD binding domain-containing protein [Ktedonobacteraceae bacterium]